MDEHEDTIDGAVKACPRCFELVNAEAEICKYCLSQIGSAQDGQVGRVRIQAGDIVYRGDIHVGKTERMSDAINDMRRFIVLSNVEEEGKLRDLHVGFLAINKDSIESIRLCQDDER